MTPLYLRSIEISNFRAYGDPFTLSLPGPGVTILTGPEGLGKSTFFEAIEWALTGRVRRREALHGLLARREEEGPVAQFRVSLEFVNGEAESRRVERRAVREQESRERFAEVSPPAPQQLLDLLRADSWPNEIHDLGEYLRLTHLGAPPGTAPIELIVRRLGSKTARAFAARMRQLEMEKARAQQALDHWHELLSRRSRLAQSPSAGEGLPAEVITERALAMAAALKATLGVELALEGAPPAVLLARLSEAVGDIEQRRRAAEARRDTLLQLIAAREKVAQGVKQRTSLMSENDRHTHEVWMIQSFLLDITKNLRQHTELDSRIRTLLLAKQEAGLSSANELELENAQSEREQLPTLESLHERQAGMKARTEQLSSIVKENHEVAARVEQELLAPQALLKQHPELLSALGKLPEDEAKALDEAARAIEQLVHEERQLAQSSETQELDPKIASLRQREAKLQEFREQHKRLAEAWLAWEREEELRQVELEINEHTGRESPPTVDAVEERLRASLATAVDDYNRGLEAQRIASAAGKLAQEAHRTYSESVLRPVETLVQRYALALSTFPAASGPNEGRRTAPDVAWLLSMSTAYPWSRWPALLLDEPLQQQELIHPAAFIEVLRNLVRERKYQIILSTRDEALADDMRRKMMAAGIECVTCRYRGLSPSGVLYSTS